MISVSVVEPEMLDNGWELTSYELATLNTETMKDLDEVQYIHQIYTKAIPYILEESQFQFFGINRQTAL